jgi:hypothetical protein
VFSLLALRRDTVSYGNKAALQGEMSTSGKNITRNTCIAEVCAFESRTLQATALGASCSLPI